MSFFKWSKVAANNASADASCPFPEGMAPSALNDGTRGMMAAAAKFRDDVGGLLLTGGTATAYTLTSNQGFTSKALMDGAQISFTVNPTNGAAPTLNVDGLGADPIIIDTAGSSSPVPAGTLLQGGVYSAVYYNSGNTWRLKDFYQLPFVVPIGGMVDYFGSSAPSANFIFPFGQEISRITYAACFALMGTSFGVGNGTTTFNVPDVRGRVTAGVDNMGGVSALRLTAASGMVNGLLGQVGGGETKTLVTANLPPYTPAGGVATTVSTLVGTNTFGGTGASNAFVPNGAGNQSNNFNVGSTGASTFTGTAQGGTSTPVASVQPTICCNKILRII